MDPSRGPHREPKRRQTTRDVSLKRRRGLLFGKFEAKEVGTTHLFPLFSTFPWHIREHSSFLALHLTTIGLFAILLLLYSLLALYPLLDCLSADKYRFKYTPVSASGEKFEDTCEKGFGSARYTILHMSLGNFCPKNDFSNPMDCGSLCVIPDRFKVSCNIKPCISVEDTRCCKMTMDEANDGEDVPTMHMWIWAVGGTLLYCIWILTVQKAQSETARAVKNKNINISDYAVMLSNLGGSDGDDNDLEDFGRHYGEVVMAFHIRTLGRVLSKTKQIDKAVLMLAEMRYMAHESCSGVFSWLYTRWMCGFLSLSAATRKQEKYKEKLTQELRKLESEPLNCTGNAIIVFNDELSARQMLWDHQRRLSATLPSQIFSPSFVRSFHIFTRGRLSTAPTIELNVVDGDSSQVRRRYIGVMSAPEPSEFWWQNTKAGGLTIIRRRIAGWGIYLLLLVIAFVVQFTLGFFAEGERMRKLEGQNDTIDASSTSLEGLKNTAATWAFSISKAIATLLFSAIGLSVIQLTSDFELHVTSSANVGATVTKLALYNLTNSFVVTILAVWASTSWSNSEDDLGENRRALWYTQGGFVETAFLIQVINIIFPPLAGIWRLYEILNIHFFSHYAVSQKAVDHYLDPQPFQLANRLAQAINTLGLSLLYAPILPISPILGFFAILAHYLSDQYMSLRHSLKPRAFNEEALNNGNRILRMLPLAQLVLLQLYFRYDHAELSVPFGVGFGIWAFFALAPLRYWTGALGVSDTLGRPLEVSRPKLLTLSKELQLRKTSATQGATSTLTLVRDLPEDVRIVPDNYLPEMGVWVSVPWYKQVENHIRFINRPLPPHKKLLPQQISATSALSRHSQHSQSPLQRVLWKLFAFRPMGMGAARPLEAEPPFSVKPTPLTWTFEDGNADAEEVKQQTAGLRTPVLYSFTPGSARAAGTAPPLPVNKFIVPTPTSNASTGSGSNASVGPHLVAAISPTVPTIIEPEPSAQPGSHRSSLGRRQPSEGMGRAASGGADRVASGGMSSVASGDADTFIPRSTSTMSLDFPVTMPPVNVDQPSVLRQSFQRRRPLDKLSGQYDSDPHAVYPAGGDAVRTYSGMSAPDIPPTIIDAPAEGEHIV